MQETPLYHHYPYKTAYTEVVAMPQNEYIERFTKQYVYTHHAPRNAPPAPRASVTKNT